jgi:hypothetical protein
MMDDLPLFNERQRDYIDRCKLAGFGWRKFALSVEKQGWCSKKQEDTLLKMARRIEMKPVKRHRMSRELAFGGGEIMSFGLEI